MLIPQAVAGNASAQFHIGLMHDFGKGVSQDHAEAARWYRQAAEQGHGMAQLNLGVSYARGEGVPQNHHYAARWYRRAADQGIAQAQFSLGALYDLGEGVPKNASEAVRWYRMAAEQRHSAAQFLLGNMHEHGRSVPQDYAEAARWYRLAANEGEATGQHSLGRMYFLGWGVPQDYMTAYMWLNLAAAHQTIKEWRELSIALRDLAAAQLSPAQLARAQEMARNWPVAARDIHDARPLMERLQAERARRAKRNRAVQQFLADLGYEPGPVDGVIGPRSRVAIRAFQADTGLPADGEVSDELHAALTAAASRGHRAAAVQSAAKPWEHYQPAASAPTLRGTGTGFAVGMEGHLVTNHHVVDQCSEVRVRPPGEEAMTAVVVAADPGNDLALLKAPVHLPAPLALDDRGLRPGDSVLAVGFPLHGLLAAEASVTTGAVSALAGIGNDSRFLQITVPVQPGNSGGPLLDLGGRVVGVVVGKLDAIRVASLTGDIPQNVNFALKAGVVRSFLDASGADLSPDARAGDIHPLPRSPAAVGAEAKAFTVLVECWK